MLGTKVLSCSAFGADWQNLFQGPKQDNTRGSQPNHLGRGSLIHVNSLHYSEVITVESDQSVTELKSQQLWWRTISGQQEPSKLTHLLTLCWLCLSTPEAPEERPGPGVTNLISKQLWIKFSHYVIQEQLPPIVGIQKLFPQKQILHGRCSICQMPEKDLSHGHDTTTSKV